MNHRTPAFLAAASAVVIGLGACAANALQSISDSSAAQPPAQPLSEPLIESIASAQDPSAAIQAFAAAAAALPGSTAVASAYVQRMVDFGLPEMAESQARELTQTDPTNPLPWSVSAYMSARRGQLGPAYTEIAAAVDRGGSDPFTVRTAAQLLAWYDKNADQSTIPDPTRAALVSVRQSLSTNPEFTSAYDAAVESFAASPAQPEPPAPEQPAPSAPAAPASEPIVVPNSTPAPAPTQQIVYADTLPVYDTAYVGTTYVYASPVIYPYYTYTNPFYYCSPWWYSSYPVWCPPRYSGSYCWNGGYAWSGGNRYYGGKPHGGGNWNGGNWNGGNWNGGGGRPPQGAPGAPRGIVSASAATPPAPTFARPDRGGPRLTGSPVGAGSLAAAPTGSSLSTGRTGADLVAAPRAPSRLGNAVPPTGGARPSGVVAPSGNRGAAPRRTLISDSAAVAPMPGSAPRSGPTGVAPSSSRGARSISMPPARAASPAASSSAPVTIPRLTGSPSRPTRSAATPSAVPRSAIRMPTGGARPTATSSSAPQAIRSAAPSRGIGPSRSAAPSRSAGPSRAAVPRTIRMPTGGARR
ncbi:MAG: hypothetical protein KF745_13115 [Phycisphaeraceae bacterium]|nr:hypothetical protein [Phycisphaeraceae bacterium]